MIAICDFCPPPPGDRDMSYAFGRPEELELRFTTQELSRLDQLRQWVYYELNGGEAAGPAWHDIAPDKGQADGS